MKPFKPVDVECTQRADRHVVCDLDRRKPLVTRLDFSSPGTFLVQLDGSGGCGELNLYAQIVVTNLPSVELVSFDMGAALDSVMCAGDELSVVAEVSGLD